MDQHIKLIIKEEISLLLTAGNKIVTKTKKFAWWRVSYVKVIKGDYLSEKK